MQCGVVVWFVIVIARHMRWGRQEDAHEFLRYVVDALQRAALVGVTKYVGFSVFVFVISRICYWRFVGMLLPHCNHDFGCALYSQFLRLC